MSRGHHTQRQVSTLDSSVIGVVFPTAFILTGTLNLCGMPKLVWVHHALPIQYILILPHSRIKRSWNIYHRFSPSLRESMVFICSGSLSIHVTYITDEEIVRGPWGPQCFSEAHSLSGHGYVFVLRLSIPLTPFISWVSHWVWTAAKSLTIISKNIWFPSIKLEIPLKKWSVFTLVLSLPSQGTALHPFHPFHHSSSLVEEAVYLVWLLLANFFH